MPTKSFWRCHQWKRRPCVSRSPRRYFRQMHSDIVIFGSIITLLFVKYGSCSSLSPSSSSTFDEEIWSPAQMPFGDTRVFDDDYGDASPPGSAANVRENAGISKKVSATHSFSPVTRWRQRVWRRPTRPPLMPWRSSRRLVFKSPPLNRHVSRGSLLRREKATDSDRQNLQRMTPKVTAYLASLYQRPFIPTKRKRRASVQPDVFANTSLSEFNATRRIKAFPVSASQCFGLMRAYQQYVFKLSDHGAECEGPGDWKPLDPQCPVITTPGRKCSDMCQTASCFLRYSACGVNTTCKDYVKDDATNGAAHKKDMPAGCYLDSEDGVMRWQMNEVKTSSPMARRVCTLQMYDLGDTPTVSLGVCGKVGRHGPNQADCDKAYHPGTVQVVAGIQIFTIRRTGYYDIFAWGAQGGHYGRGQGGKGAQVEGRFELNKGERIAILVGQPGSGTKNQSESSKKNDDSEPEFGGGGGGGTTVGTIVKSGGDKVTVLGLQVAPLVVAGGGAGMWVEAASGVAAGGAGLSQDTPKRASAGGKTGGGGGYKFAGGGGEVRAQSFVSGGTGGGNDKYFGGFGGGGGPALGGGGGGGFRGGDCVHGSGNKNCDGGASMGGKASVGVQAGAGKVTFASVPGNAKHDVSNFKVSRDNGIFVGKLVDFDLGCGNVGGGSCREGNDMSDTYSWMGITFKDTKNVYSNISKSRGFCGANIQSGELGSSPMSFTFDIQATRVGFYHFGKEPLIMVTVEDGNGRSQEYEIEDNAFVRPKHTGFFGVSGTGIRKLTVQGLSYCIDDLRWKDDSEDVRGAGTVDFAESGNKNKVMNPSEISAGASQSGVQMYVTGWSSYASKANGFICNGDNDCDDSMSVVAKGLVAFVKYRFFYWGFEDEEPDGRDDTDWVMIANGEEVGAGGYRMCSFPVGKRPPLKHPHGVWLPHCGPNVVGSASADGDGSLNFTWVARRRRSEDTQRRANVDLSGFAIFPLTRTSSTTTLRFIKHFIDENVCGGFDTSKPTFHGAHEMTDVGFIHGRFVGSQVQHTFTDLPPHDTVTITVRFWAMDTWENESGRVGIDNQELWIKEHNMVPSECTKNATTADGWNTFKGYVPSNTRKSCAKCYTDIATGIPHTNSEVEVFLASSIVGDLEYKSWGFGGFRLAVGQVSRVIAAESDSHLITDWSHEETTQRDGHKPPVHGFWGGGVSVTKTFTDLDPHEFLFIEIRYIAIGAWAKVDGIIRVDGVDAWRKVRKDATSCNNPDSEAWHQNSDDVFQVDLAMSANSNCYFQASVAVAHRAPQATIEVTSTLPENSETETAWFAFSDMTLRLGGETQQCEHKLCPSGFRLLSGPPWCAGDCERHMCCEKLGICLPKTCNYDAGWVKRVAGAPKFCEGPKCTPEECCSPRARCQHELCGYGFRLKDGDNLPEQCATFECSASECCEEMGMCTQEVCGEGYRLLSATISCLGPICTKKECCSKLGMCESVACMRGFRLQHNAPKYCAGQICKNEECCENLGQCTLDSCARGSKLRTDPAPPEFCREPICRDSECCVTLGTCSTEMCNAKEGWYKKAHWVELCAEEQCEVHECCDPLQHCKDMACPVGFLPRTKPPFVEICAGVECEPQECCEATGGGTGDDTGSRGNALRVSDTSSICHVITAAIISAVLSTGAHPRIG
eukprot:TRINITY_DN28349_c0_g1_i1.p1 TRINITY_DN28349_c0_g1~~TRINITY_DN28349_c0_g1_i1.p1  ORF type:complete len:1655 (-),score=268.25 TRINITY_DN28349_c0_g1_i1:49-5013(-)